MTWTCPTCETVFPEAGLRQLTRMERRVLQALLDGWRPRTIAAELGISYNTVRTHRDHVIRKLGVHTQVEAVLYAVQHGMHPTIANREPEPTEDVAS